METINNMASAAAKAVWGTNEANGTAETKHEPVSGVAGDTSKGEPFDGGNLNEEKQAQIVNKPNKLDKPSGTPEVTAPADTTQGQNDTRDPSDSTTNLDAATQDVNDEGSGPQGVNLNAPGPKPLIAVAKEHGGDAGNMDKAEANGEQPSDSAEDSPEDDANGIQKQSHGSGTGEQYVKSSGLQADGGNFDASAPGAGREADRLLEKKGIKREATPPTKSDESVNETKNVVETETVDETETAKKPSLKEKIKAKLHAH